MVVVKISLFQNMVVLEIKVKGMTNSVTCKQIFCPCTHPRPLGWGQRSAPYFSESSYDAYQLNGNAE